MDISKKEAKSKIFKLKEDLNKHNHLYYVENNPLISDYEFDQLLRELIKLEEKFPEYKTLDSPSQRVGGTVADGFESYKHKVRMMSIDNVTSEKEAIDFDTRVKKFLETEENIQYLAQPKFDGVSSSLTYEKGVLTHGVTRGDGYSGENITNNIKTIKSIPLNLFSQNKIPELIEIRGEVIFPIKAFNKLNNELAKMGEPLFVNPRNTASGTLRQLDSTITASRPLDFYAWGIGEVVNYQFTDELEIFNTLKKWGFKLESNIKDCRNIKEAIDYHKNLEEQRNSLEYEVDGSVIKVKSIRHQKELGTTAKYPRWSVAFKFKPKQANTKVNEITVQVGRIGLLTPVAELEPVNIGGITVKRASLHTEDIITTKDIRIGDSVVVQRAGDVIPEVVKPVVESRTGEEKVFKMPSKCPVCNTSVEKEGSYYYCPNISCSAQLKGRIQYLASRNSFDIEGLGEKIVDQLINEDLLKDLSDVFKLDKEKLINLERFADKSASNLIDEIEKSKNVGFDRFLNSLSIKHVGQRLAQVLADNFDNLEELSNSTYDELIEINTVGPEIAESIVNFFNSERSKQLIKNLFNCGVNIIYPDNSHKTNKLEGLTFVITGTLDSLTREEAKKFIEQNGGKVTSSVSKKTSYLLAGENPGSKVEKAKSLNINIISENDLKNLIIKQST